MDMKKNCIKIAVTLLLTINFVYTQNADKLQVDVYYESRCPDSRSFMQQLKKVYPRIKDKVKIHYVPFGKAFSYSESGTTKFDCQHGFRECQGNLFQSCVLNLIGEHQQDLQTDFATCAMDFSKDPRKCAETRGINLNEVDACVNGKKGLELQLQAEKESKEIIRRSMFVPTIVYNKSYNANDFWESLNNLESVVHKKL